MPGRKSLQASVLHSFFSSYVTGASPILNGEKVYTPISGDVRPQASTYIYHYIYRIRTATVSFVLYSLAPSSMYHNVTRVKSCFTILSIPPSRPAPPPFSLPRLNFEYLYIYIHPGET